MLRNDRLGVSMKRIGVVVMLLSVLMVSSCLTRQRIGSTVIHCRPYLSYPETQAFDGTATGGPIITNEAFLLVNLHDGTNQFTTALLSEWLEDPLDTNEVHTFMIRWRRIGANRLDSTVHRIVLDGNVIFRREDHPSLGTEYDVQTIGATSGHKDCGKEFQRSRVDGDLEAAFEE